MASSVQDAIMLFGDSITQCTRDNGMNGFGQRLAHVYARRLDVLNRGVVGCNTERALTIFERCLATKCQLPDMPQIRLLTIWFGANDARIEPSPQHVPLHKFSANLRKLVDIVQCPESPYHSPSTRIILMSPPPVNTYQRGAVLEARVPPVALDRDFQTTKLYAEAVKDVAHEKGVAFVDIWTAMWQAAGESEQDLSRFLHDGLHPNAEGYKIIYDALIKVIRDEYPDVHYENLPFTFPPWVQAAGL